MRNTRPLRFVMMVVMALGMIVGPAAAGEPTAQDILAQADRYRLPSLDNRLQVSLVSRKGDETVGDAHYTVWTKGTDRSRVQMLDPKVRGQRVLMTEEGMWLFIPTTRQAIRITPMQRLLGEASYGDIGRMVWRDDYTAAFDPGQKTRTVDGVAAWRLVLTARKPSAVYTRIDLTVAAGDGRPLTADFFLASGKKFKTATFDPPQAVGGQPIVTRIRFTDELDRQRHTLMELSEVTSSDLPDSAFTQAGLSRD